MLICLFNKIHTMFCYFFGLFVEIGKRVPFDSNVFVKSQDYKMRLDQRLCTFHFYSFLACRKYASFSTALAMQIS